MSLIALSIGATRSENARLAFEALPKLRHAEVHSTVILAQVDSDTFRKLGLHVTTEPRYQSKRLYHK